MRMHLDNDSHVYCLIGHQSFAVLYVPWEDPFTEFPTPNTGLSSRYGYLYLRVWVYEEDTAVYVHITSFTNSQKGGLAAKWERTFFFTKNGYLYTQSLQKVQRSFHSLTALSPHLPISPSPHLPISHLPISPSPPFSPSPHLPCPILWQHSYKIITY